MRQLTITAFYGSKIRELSKFIRECQGKIWAKLGDNFLPYTELQVHATIVSLARKPFSTFINQSFLKHRNELHRMDFNGMLNCIRTSDAFPLKVKIGGFQKDFDEFVSLSKKPYERSFTINDEIILVMGWPVENTENENQSYPDTLYQLRKSFENYGVLHDYHKKINMCDNDFYMRLGLIKSTNAIDDALKQEFEEEMRDWLSIAGMVVELQLSDIYLVSYSDPKLPLNSTKAWSLDDNRLTPDFIENLYD